MENVVLQDSSLCPCVSKLELLLSLKTTGLDKQNLHHKIVNIFLPINFNICFGCSKELSH